MEDKLLRIRHSLAHVLASAVLEHDDKASFGTGPATDNGFYYDIALSSPINEEDLPKLEEIMREILSKGFTPELHEITYEDAKQRFKDQAYKLELIEKIHDAGEKLTTYTIGTFTDLCEGPHVESSKDIDPESFMLSNVAGAYWQGSEENDMLTRIYGIAFETKEDLDAYKEQQEEAKKRDHRKIAKAQNLYVFSKLVGPGLPLFTPKGNAIRNEIIEYSRELNKKLGFGEVHTPNFNKADLFKKSGHYEKYREDMFTVQSQYVKDEMFLKPMNCPQHTQIFDSEPRSYRDLPIRFADFANLYRDERPGELSGLTRLRGFAQDDGHIFCTEEQIEKEISMVLGAIQEALKTYGIDYFMRLSLRDSEKKENYLGDDAVWEESQSILRTLLLEKNITFTEEEGEAAFYGPKIDVVAVDAIGREWQISTIQLDFNMPTRLNLSYTNKEGKKEVPIMIHRALVGSPDRFLGLLLEHFAGALPLWLSPVQIGLVPIGKEHEEYTQKIKDQLEEAGLRVEINNGKNSLGKRIYSFKESKVPYIVAIGDEEVANNIFSLEHRDLGKLDSMNIEEVIKKLSLEKTSRQLS